MKICKLPSWNCFLLRNQKYCEVNNNFEQILRYNDSVLVLIYMFRVLVI